MTTFGDLIAQGRMHENVWLGPLTTYKLGGPARMYMEIVDEADLPAIAEALSVEPHPVLVIGRGSNLVIADTGWPGLAVRFGFRFTEIGLDPAPGWHAHAGAATTLPRLARETVNQGRGGLEFFVGIPGSVGGAVRTNAGGHGSETADWLVTARLFDLETGEFRTVANADLNFRYRSSSVAPTELVVSAEFRTEPVEVEVGQERLLEITRWRREHQPGGTLNAGSVFRNPEGDAAGRIIDALGLKGFRVGGACVSSKHANFFEADQDATAQDVYDLVREVRRLVQEETGIELVPEIQFAGAFA
jgi:UDP-N-acetylmuramate dehydrogenase